MKRLIVLPLALCGLLFVPGSARAEEPCGAWSPVPLPDPEGVALRSVSASSAADVWAVGQAAWHWDGGAWTRTPMPGLASPDTVVRAVAAVAPGDAWAVGWWAFLGSPQTLVQRWDGARWSVVPSPTIPGGSQFDAVYAVAPDDVWAVGSRAGGHPDFDGTRVTLTAHWDGSSWTAVPSPNVSNRSHELMDVAGTGPNDVWAVGSWRNIGGPYQTLILHWNGSAWSVVPSPNLPGFNGLSGVSALAPNDAWAVGDAWDGVTGRQVFLHWDGTAWSQVEGPGGATACADCVADVLALGPDDVWAVGGHIGHWDGTQWTLVPSPAVPGATGVVTRSLAKVGDCAAWAVGGSFDANGVEHALALRLVPSVTVEQPPVAVDPALPAVPTLRVAPNPSRGECRLELSLPVGEAVRVSLVDAGGRRIGELHRGPLDPGLHVLRWDGRDAGGRRAAAGVYFAVAELPGRRITVPVLRVR